MRSFVRIGTARRALLLVFFCGLCCFFASSRIPAHVRAQAPTPDALPPGLNLGLDALVYRTDFTDAAAWPTITGHAQTVFAADGHGGYHASSAAIVDPVWGPATVYAGRDYYAELSFDLESCGSQGTIYFVVRMSQPTVIEGNAFVYSVSCDGKFEARRVFGGDLRADSSLIQASTFTPGHHQIGVLSSGSSGRWFVDGREAGKFDNILMPLSGRAGFGVSGSIAFDVQQLRIWTLAADAPPTGTGALIYDADFLADSQWPQGLGDSVLARTADEIYLLSTLAGSKPFTALSGRVDAADDAVQLIFAPRRCEADASIGVLFRAVKTTATRAYVFALQCDGRYGAGLFDSSSGTPLQWDKTGTINPMTPFAGSRNMAVLVKGSAATLFVDGQQVDSLPIQGMPRPGDAGIFAYSASGSIQAGIRSFSVWSAK